MASPVAAEQLRALCETDVTQRLTKEQILPVLMQAPFVHVEGTFNVRDLGLLPGAAAGGSGGGGVRPKFAYRSGMLNRLTERGKATLAGDLGVRRIFDFRSRSEHAQAPDPVPADSVTGVWHETSEETPDIALDLFDAGYGEAGFAATYLDVLKAYQPTIRLLLEHVRDRPEQPFLFHCTAGRDRTGVIAGLLLTLAGAPADTIVLDYLLSRIGTEPVRDELVKFARAGAGLPPALAGADSGSDPEAAAAAAAAVPRAFLNLVNLRAVCWKAFLEALDKEYGGYEGYVTSVLGFSDADLATIKKNLTTAQ